VDGVLEEGDLPEAIAPHQPFMGMQAISHEVMPGVWAEVRFEGDVFEMEDQRNWTDASFKTYCTPLDLPFPVRITEGSQIRQSIRLSVSDGVPPTRATGVTQTEEVVLALRDAPPVRLPRIGLGSASHGETLTELEVARLRKLDLGHLRVDLWMEEEGWEDVLRAASAEAGALGVGLEAALYLSDSSGDALGRLRGALDDLHPKIARWLVFDAMTRHTEVGEVLLARRHLAAYDPDAPIGGGTDAYFTELNRQRPPTESLDLVCYSLNPQVHAFDDASIVETLEAQGTTVQSARGFVGGLPVAVSPVTMKPRFNPNATGEALDSPPGTLPPEADARQISLLGAGWTLGSIKYLSESGVSSITYYETTGWRGTMETEAGSSLPDAFPSTPGTVFPLYHVLADVGEFSGGVMLPGRSTRPLDVDGLVLRSRDRVRVLLANLSAQDQRVRIECDGMGSRVRVSRLDAHTAQRAMSDPEAYRAEQGIEEQVRDGVFGLSLPPHGLVRIDCEEKADG
jgi:hypothetical protein